MKRAQDLPLTPYLKFMVYGRSGVGKTKLLATACKLGPTLYIDFDQNGVVGLTNEERKNMYLMIPDTAEEFQDIYNKLAKYLDFWDKVNEGKGNDFIQKEIKTLWKFFVGEGHSEIDEPKQFISVCIDNITELQRDAMQIWVPQELATKFNEMKRPQIQDWGSVIAVVKLVIDGLRQLPINVFIAALEDVEEKGNKLDPKAIIEVRYAPMFNGQRTAEEVCAQMDIVAHMVSKPSGPNLARVLILAQSSTKVAKDRFSLGKELIDTSIPAIMELVKASREKAMPAKVVAPIKK